jgi:HSP20 family protein
MVYVTSDPWRELNQLQREMNRLFDHSLRQGPAEYPSVNIWADKENARITAELPGYQDKDVQITVLGDILKLSGSRKAPDCGKDECFHRQERFYGSFEREIKLPFLVDVAEVGAEFRNGLLLINLPRAEADKPRKIEIRSK